MDWDPAAPDEVGALFAKFPGPWWIAGGHAIEHAVGRRLRPHADIDVLVLRRDQLALRDALAGWDLWAADPPGTLRQWRPGETLPDGVHDVWCRPSPGLPWRIQVLLDEAAGDDWVSRHTSRVRRPLAALGRGAPPYLAPEIQLFYKAKDRREKDETDFAAVLPHLSAGARAWLTEAITEAYDPAHPWLDRLRVHGERSDGARADWTETQSLRKLRSEERAQARQRRARDEGGRRVSGGAERPIQTEPVLIAGAGPVGMVSALLLARHGVPSVLLESQPERVAVGSRSICVQGDVLDILERIGLGAQLADIGVTWLRGRTYYREHQVFEITFPEQADRAFPPFVNIPQSVVELLLEERVVAEPLIELRRGHEVVGVEQDAGGIRVSTMDGSEFAGTHLIGADGPRSAVRRLLDLPFDGVSFDDKFLIADIRADLGFTVPERRFYFDPEWNPGRQVLVHPQPGGVWRIDWQVPADFDLAVEERTGGLDDRVKQIAGDAPYDIVWMSVYRFHQRRVPRMVVGKILLAGDAAHVMSPFGARGLNSGISDADNAVWKVVVDRAGRAGPALLESYDHERGAAAAENLRVTGETMRFLVPQTEADRERRADVLARSVDDPDVRVEIDSGRLAEPFFYLDSPLTTRADDVARARFPREPGVPRPPLPGVLCPDGRLSWGGMRLRELVAARFVLLTCWCDWTPADRWEHELIGQPVPVGLDEDDKALVDALGLRPRSAVLVRPDGHIAAVLTEPPGGIGPLVTRALRRATGWLPDEDPA